MLAPVPPVLREFGLDPAPVLAGAGFDIGRLVDGDSGLSLRTFAATLAHCAEASGCPHFGLLVGERVDTRLFGDTARLMAESPRVGDALQTFVLRHHLVDAGAVAMLLPAGRGRAQLAYSVYTPVPRGLAVTVDVAAVIGVRLLRLLCGSAWQPLMVRLPHRAPEETTAYRRAFGQNVAFDAAMTAIVFSAAWLKAPVARDPDVQTVRESAQRDAEPLPDLPLAHLVRRVLRPMVFTGTATQPDVARMFSLHPRALSRRLRAEAATFQALLTDARMDIARQLLRDTELPVSHVANVLHYAEPSAFTKAFREHCGTSPRAWRERQRSTRLRDQRRP